LDKGLLIDLYELTMCNCYYVNNFSEIGVFDYFFRKVPDNKNYAIFAGLETALDTIINLKFSKSDIKFLKDKNIFNEGFLNYLSNFKFSCDVYSFNEGDVIFPNEPVLIIKGPLIECQLLETILLLNLNHQSLIATKARQIYEVTKDRPFYEFGARRAQGESASIYGVRGAYIGGSAGTSNVICNKLFNIPIIGTMAHSFIESFDTEYDAFLAYAKCFPKTTSLLIDTYDVMNGVLNAIKLEKEYFSQINSHLLSVRLDSGDLKILSKKIRKLLDDNNMPYIKIFASNSLDESSIKDLLDNDSPIDTFGIGERLITAKNDPVFSGVYKLSAIIKDSKILPKMKLSATTDKETLPGFKQVYRVIDKNKSYLYDYITLRDEIIDDISFIPKLNKIVENGKIIEKLLTLDNIKDYSLKEFNNLSEDYKGLNYNKYQIKISPKLSDLQNTIKSEINN
jgi:nicotinate phosphoribosyltransferase